MESVTLKLSRMEAHMLLELVHMARESKEVDGESTLLEERLATLLIDALA